MSVPPERFARVEGRVNVSLLAAKRVIVVGVGSVGSQIAEQLADTGVGHLRFVDDDLLDETNLARHALTRAYLGMNKAEGMTLYLADEIPTLQTEAIPRKVDDSMSDNQLDQLLHDADLIVAATGDHEVQRRVARRALALDIPAIIPGLHEHQGGEVFVQRSPRQPCFSCWDGHRPITQPLRGVAATNPDILAIIQLAAWLTFAILDPHSEYARTLLVVGGGARPPQLFVQNNLTLARQTVDWRDNCPSCEVGPSPLNPEAREAWEAARQARTETSDSRQAIRQPGAAQPANWGSGAVVMSVLVLLALLIGVIGLITSGSGKQTLSGGATASVPTKSPQEVAAQKAAKEQAAAKRIAQLRFRCIKRYICQLALGGENSLPLYIEGMDEHLQDYLSAHGYTDLWTNSAHTFSIRFIAPGRTKNNETYQVGKEEDIRLRYVATITAPTSCGCESVGSGLLLEATTPIEPEGIGVWTVFWQLKNRSRQVVKRLHYTVNVDNCENTGSGEPTPCGHSIDARSEEWPHFKSPPLFPYGGEG